MRSLVRPRHWLPRATSHQPHLHQPLSYLVPGLRRGCGNQGGAAVSVSGTVDEIPNRPMLPNLPGDDAASRAGFTGQSEMSPSLSRDFRDSVCLLGELFAVSRTSLMRSPETRAVSSPVGGGGLDIMRPADTGGTSKIWAVSGLNLTRNIHFYRWIALTIGTESTIDLV